VLGCEEGEEETERREEAYKPMMSWREELRSAAREESR
jgi:hypothetical protein